MPTLDHYGAYLVSAFAVTVVVLAPPNLPPAANADAATTSAGVPVTLSVLANDTDPNGDPLTVTAVSGAVGCYWPAGSFFREPMPSEPPGEGSPSLEVEAAGAAATSSRNVAVGTKNSVPVTARLKSSSRS